MSIKFCSTGLMGCGRDELFPQCLTSFLRSEGVDFKQLGVVDCCDYIAGSLTPEIIPEIQILQAGDSMRISLCY